MGKTMTNADILRIAANYAHTQLDLSISKTQVFTSTSTQCL